MHKPVIRASGGDVRCRHREHTRGAAFLLSIYISALTLLLFGGIALQRTAMETRAANLSRDMAQSFWLAEGALDSAMVLARKTSLVDLQPYTVATVAGTSQFTPQLIAGEVLPPSGATPVQQQLQHRIHATGTVANVTTNLSAIIQETGPLTGVWGNGIVVANGGSTVSQAFVTGSMHSLIGSLTSTLDDKVPTGFGLMDIVLNRLHRAGHIVFGGLAQVTPSQGSSNLDALAGQASTEMISVKEGYKFVKGMPSGVMAENDSAVNYVSTPKEGQIPNLIGAGSVGLIKPIPAIDLPKTLSNGLPLNPSDCKKNLILGNTAAFDVYNNFSDPTTGIRDLTPGADRVTLCVNAITADPNNATAWQNILTAQQAPVIIFRKPTTIYVTGSVPVNLETLPAPNPNLGEPTVAKLFGHVGLPLGKGGVQTKWNVAVAANLNPYTIGTDINYTLHPLSDDAVHLVVTNTSKPGTVFVQPGRFFSGFIDAPQSLVVFLQRAPGNQVDQHGVPVPLVMQGIVGNEVIVDLEQDAIQFGTSSGSSTTANSMTTTVLGWLRDANPFTGQ